MPVASDFRVVTLANNANNDLYGNSNGLHGNPESGSFGVVAMDIAPDGKVFIAKMCSGDIMVYEPTGANPSVTTHAGRVPVRCNNEEGLLGVVVDPDFASTGWIYVFHADSSDVDFSPGSPLAGTTAHSHSLTRYTYVPGNPAGSRLVNPRTILRIPRVVGERAFHGAGGLDITPNGTIVIGTGDDTNPHNLAPCAQNAGFGPLWFYDPTCDAARTAGNTNDLRGKILRIKPIPFPDGEQPAPGIGSTYAIPAGNLWEYIADPAFNPNWDPVFDNVDSVRKEIYTMGHRNPYHPRIDAKSGWVFTGEVGPDARSDNPSRGPHGMEEWNLAVRPGFYGHPFCIGPNLGWNALVDRDGTAGVYGAPFNCAAVQNTSPNNTGVRNLPPARPASLYYSSVAGTGDNYRIGFTSARTAVGGPMYRYDTALASSVKFPPQYEGKVFFFDWANTNKASFRIITLNPDGSIDSGDAAVTAFPAASLPGLPVGNYIDMRFGKHDGAMYLLKNSNGIYTNFNQASLYRIEYTGAIDNACYTPFEAATGPASLRPAPARRNLAPFPVNGMIRIPAGYRTVEVFDLSGRKVWRHTRANALHDATVTLPSGMAAGVLRARLLP